MAKTKIRPDQIRIDKKQLFTMATKSAANLFVPIMALFISLLSLFSSFNELTKQETNLSSQITEVESAIKNLRTLESYLTKTKDEMVATRIAKEKIEEEYNKAKELEKLSQSQIEAISLAINKRTKQDIFKDYFWGFVLGVAGSLTASFIYSNIRNNKQKNENGDAEPGA